MNHKRRALLALLFCSAMACHPTIDTSSNAKLVTSVARVRYTLDRPQRDQFDEALLTVVSQDLRSKGIAYLALHPGEILPEARAAIEGKTGDQVIAQARRSKRSQKAE